MAMKASLAANVGRGAGTASTGSIIETMLATNGQWLVTVHNARIVKHTLIPRGHEVAGTPWEETEDAQKESE